MKSAIEQSASLSTQKSRTADIGSGSVCRMPVALGQGAGSAAALCSPKGHCCSSSEHRDLCHTRASVYCLNTLKAKMQPVTCQAPSSAAHCSLLKHLNVRLCVLLVLCAWKKGHVPVHCAATVSPVLPAAGRQLCSPLPVLANIFL